MHRFVKAILDGQPNIIALIPVSETALPSCEAHVVYDLILGCERHVRTAEGFERLRQSLVLLCQSYANVPGLLAERFNEDRIRDEQISAVIEAALAEYSQLIS
jgi:hypothetical protein